MLTAAFSGLLADSLFEASGLSELLFSLISFAIIFAIMSVVFYLSGFVVVGKSRTSFKDAFAISVLGTLVLVVCLSVFSLEVAAVLSLAAWLLLVRHYYETGLLGSVAVGLTSVVVAVIILCLLSVLFGSSLFFSWAPV